MQENDYAILQPATGVRFVMPKFVALGVSPFAATRYTNETKMIIGYSHRPKRRVL